MRHLSFNNINSIICMMYHMMIPMTAQRVMIQCSQQIIIHPDLNIILRLMFHSLKFHSKLILHITLHTMQNINSNLVAKQDVQSSSPPAAERAILKACRLKGLRCNHQTVCQQQATILKACRLQGL